jgi:dihydrofolate synthase/folylpolyglutamate synthase
MNLAGWLAHLEHRNADMPIVLGLDRVKAVAHQLGLMSPAFPILTVGGTNGKGSVCAYLEAMLAAAGMRVACYTSPHVLRYNERVRVAGVEATDDELSAAIEIVEAARGDTPLTYFEQGTLAAMQLFQASEIDVAVLEVGLGGRLDAVNLWDSDCAIVVSVDLDHQVFLGNTRESIGFEKAGIFRPHRPAVCGDLNPPASLLDKAAELGTPLLRLGSDIRLQDDGSTWSVNVADATFPALPRPIMAGTHQFNNAACAIAALHSVRAILPVSRQAIRAGILGARQPGRFQMVGENPLRVLDVAHNPHAARALAANLVEVTRQKHADSHGHAHHPIHITTHTNIHTQAPASVRVVLGMLSDKDVSGVLEPLLPLVKHWYCGGLPGPRGLSGADLGAFLAQAQAQYTVHEDIADAWQAACAEARSTDTICAFGSFHTVAEVMACLSS